MQHIRQGKDIREMKVDTKMSKMKAIHALWVLVLYDHQMDPSDSIRKSFEMAVITFCLHNEIEPKDPSIDLDDI